MPGPIRPAISGFISIAPTRDRLFAGRRVLLKIKKQFYKADQLQPLDVILTRPRRSAVSKKIAIGSWGKYSHAMLVLSRNMRIESVTEGVKPTRVIFSKCEVQDREFTFIERITQYKHFDVFRHPQLFNLSAKNMRQLQMKMVTLLPEVIYREYPSVKAFRKFPVGGVLVVVKSVLDLISQKPDKVIPGPFCSQLVSLLYRRLNIRLFEKDIDDDRVSPNRLSRSNLRKISEELTYTNTVGLPNDKELLEEVNESSMLLRSTIQTASLRFAEQLLASLQKSSIFVGAELKEMNGLAATLRESVVNSESVKRNINNDWVFWSSIRAIKHCWKGCNTCKLPSECRIFEKITTARIDSMLKEQRA